MDVCEVSGVGVICGVGEVCGVGEICGVYGVCGGYSAAILPVCTFPPSAALTWLFLPEFAGFTPRQLIFNCPMLQICYWAQAFSSPAHSPSPSAKKNTIKTRLFFRHWLMQTSWPRHPPKYFFVTASNKLVGVQSTYINNCWSAVSQLRPQQEIARGSRLPAYSSFQDFFLFPSHVSATSETFSPQDSNVSSLRLSFPLRSVTFFLFKFK